MLIRAILFLLLSVSLAVPTTASMAQDDLFVPKPKQEEKQDVVPSKPTAVSGAQDLRGRWIVDMTGDAVCNKGVVYEFSSNSAGTTLWRGMPGTFSSRLKARSLTVTVSYTDVFGNLAVETLSGTVSEDGYTATGTVTGTWSNGCTFQMRR